MGALRVRIVSACWNVLGLSSRERTLAAPKSRSARDFLVASLSISDESAGTQAHNQSSDRRDEPSLSTYLHPLTIFYHATMTMYCQKCRTPLKLDKSLEDLNPAAFDLLIGMLTPSLVSMSSGPADYPRLHRKGAAISDSIIPHHLPSRAKSTL